MVKKEDLLRILDDLTHDEFDKFSWYVSNENVGDVQPVDVTRLESGSRQSALDLLLQKHDLTQAVEVMKRFLTEIKRNDLVASLSNIGSGRAGQ